MNQYEVTFKFLTLNEGYFMTDQGLQPLKKGEPVRVIASLALDDSELDITSISVVKYTDDGPILIGEVENNDR